MNQMAFDLSAKLRDAGIARVIENNVSWMDNALASLEGWLALNATVTIEEFREWYRENGGEPPAHFNAWGALGRIAVSRGLIERIGYVNAQSPKTHAHPVAQYRSMLFRGQS